MNCGCVKNGCARERYPTHAANERMEGARPHPLLRPADDVTAGAVYLC